MKRKGEPVVMAEVYENSEREKNIVDGKIKYYFLRELESLPEIDQDDFRFAKLVSDEYKKIPIDDLCWLIRDIRYIVQKYQTDFEAGALSMDKNFWNKLSASGIKSISITSNEGTIELMASHPMFEHYFLPQFKEIRYLRRKILESQSKEIKFYLVDLPFSKIWRFLNTTSLGEFQKRVVTGMFLVYFNLYKVKPMMTKDEWNRNQTASSYTHYLSDNVKTWLKNI